MSHFEQLLEEGDDAEAAYLAEQLLITQLRYVITMKASAALAHKTKMMQV